MEPAGKKYLKFTTTSARYPCVFGFAGGYVAWTQATEDAAEPARTGVPHEIYWSSLEETFKPVSLGTFTEENQALVGSRIVRQDKDSQLWIAELPNGAFVKTDATSGIHDRRNCEGSALATTTQGIQDDRSPCDP